MSMPPDQLAKLIQLSQASQLARIIGGQAQQQQAQQAQQQAWLASQRSAYDEAVKNNTFSAFDQARIKAAQDAQGYGSDGRSVLSGQNLASIYNPLFDLQYNPATYGVTSTQFGMDSDSYTYGMLPGTFTGPGGIKLTEGLGLFGPAAGFVAPERNGLTVGWEFDGSGEGGGYQTRNYSESVEDYQARVAQAYKEHMANVYREAGLDPSLQYAVYTGDNPTGNGGKDYAHVLYAIGPDGAVPVTGQNKYSQGSWTSFRDGLKEFAPGALAVVGAAAGGASLASMLGAGGAGAGAAAGAAGAGGSAGAAGGLGGSLGGGSLFGADVAGLGNFGSSLFGAGGAIAPGAGFSLPSVLSGIGAGIGTSGATSLMDVLKTVNDVRKVGGLVNQVAGGGQKSGGGSGGGQMSNGITDWLSSLMGGGGGPGGVDPLQIAFANYQMQGAERDRDSAEAKAKEFADFFKDQIGRSTSLSDYLTGKLGETENGQGGIDYLKALGDKRESWFAEDRDKLQQKMGEAGTRLDDLYSSLGPAKMYGEPDVNNLAADIYGKKSGAVDRAVKLASSQGFADSLTRGLSDSSQAADTRDNVARRFADTYSGLEADSRAQATQQIGQLSDLQSKQRGAAISELTNVMNPELSARVATYKPDDTARYAGMAEAQHGTSNLGAILGALNEANRQGTAGAKDLATASSLAYAQALATLGQNRSRMVEAISPAARSALGGLGGLIGGTAGAAGGAASGLGGLVSGIGGGIKSLLDLFGGGGATGFDVPGAYDWGDWGNALLNGNPGGALFGGSDFFGSADDWSSAFDNWFSFP